MQRLLLLAALIFWLPSGYAYANTCVEFDRGFQGGDFDNVDISAGAVTLEAIKPGSARQIIMRIKLTDDDDLVTNIRVAPEEAKNDKGSPEAPEDFGKLADCDGVSPNWTCAPWTLNWNPQLHGKNWRLPIPIIWAFGRLVVTPTGEGAGDEVEVSFRVCY